MRLRKVVSQYKLIFPNPGLVLSKGKGLPMTETISKRNPEEEQD